jgi:hypothetical protein
MITELPRTAITRDQIVPVICSTGESAATLTAPVNGELKLWRSAIDQLLAWRNAPKEGDGEDAPRGDVVDSAIGFAFDQLEGASVRAPDSMVPSGAGRIAMEWNAEDGTLILEFVETGTASYTRFDRNGKIMERRLLKRNPTSRQLELRG